MALPRNQTVTQVVVVERAELDDSQVQEQIAFFNPDGTPFEFSGGGSDPGTPEDLAEHIADPTPHMAAVSGLSLAAIYAAGRI